MRQLFWLCIVLLPSACTQKTKSDDFDKERTTKEIKTMLSDYHSAIHENGLTAEFDYLDKSADFFWVPPGYTSALNYDSVKTILVENSKSLKEIELQWDALKILPLTKEIANYTGIVTSRTIDTADVVSEVAILESGTLIKRESGWKLLNGQSAILKTKTEQ